MAVVLPRLKAIGRSVAAGFTWGIAMTITAAAGLFMRGRFETFHLPTILAVFFLGGVFGWWLAGMIADAASRFARRKWLFAAISGLVLAAATVFVTAGLFALEYRAFYARWHAETLSRVWLLQFLFTSASAYYQFAVMALRLYLPLGPVLLIAGTWVMLRRPQ